MTIKAGKSKGTVTKKKTKNSVKIYPDLKILEIGGTEYKTYFSSKFLKREPYATPDPRFIYSAIPGKVIKVLVKKGQKIHPGDPIIIMDAMKMMNQISSLHGGVISSINVREGEIIPKKYLIAKMA